MPLGHESAHLLAAVALLMTGAPILVLAWRRRAGRRQAAGQLRIAEPLGSIRGAIAALIAACSSGAGVIHLAAVADHDGAAAAFFIGIAVLQIATAALWLVSPGRRLALVLTLANLGTIVVWAASRSVGIPLLPEQPEPIGRPDLIATALEVAIVLAVELWLGLDRLRPRMVDRVAGIAGILPVPILGVALIATLLAFAPQATGQGHDHGSPDVGLHQE